MQKKSISLILSILIIFMLIPNITYAVPIETNPIPLGPHLKDLKGGTEISNEFQNIKRIRANFITINIKSTSTPEELEKLDRSVDMYIESFNIIKRNLENYSSTYKESFEDLHLSSQLIFICTSYNISLIQQKYLIKSLKENRKDAEPLFYSNYLLGVYYYLSIADQMLTYIDNYYTF